VQRQIFPVAEQLALLMEGSVHLFL
jgi:hypothetical protein